MGTGAVLVNDATGETVFRIVEPVGSVVIERGEIGPDDAFARRLLGLRAGDTIEIVKAVVGAQASRQVRADLREFDNQARNLATAFPDQHT